MRAAFAKYITVTVMKIKILLLALKIIYDKRLSKRFIRKFFPTTEVLLGFEPTTSVCEYQ